MTRSFSASTESIAAPSASNSAVLARTAQAPSFVA